jgi:hypothetical protein
VPVDFTVRIGGTTRLLPERLEALEDLIEEFREEGLDGGIAYRPPTGRGVTPWEVAAIYLAGKALDAATGAVAERLLEALIDKIKGWVRRQERTRQVVTLYGRDGKPLMVVRRNGEEVTVEKPEGEEIGSG